MTNEKLRRLAVEESPVARIVVDANGVLAIANQRARALFSLNPKDIGRPLSDLEISSRPAELRSLIEQAYAERRAVTQTSVERRFPGGEPQFLDIVVAPLLDELQAPAGVGITFLDVTRPTRLQDELRATREEVQSANEELETTNRELQSSNEELQSINEELRSTNEELRSTNEELQAVNEELRRRTDELNQSNTFLRSVLGGLRGAAVVVNRNLDVLVWNERAEDQWGLRPEEAQGQSLFNLDIGLPVAELRAPLRACLADDAGHTEATVEAVNRRGKPVRCRITFSPLLSADKNRHEGVIMLVDDLA